MWKLVLFVVAAATVNAAECLLAPQDSESRQLKPLDGVWNFRISARDDQHRGFRNKWFQQPLEKTGDILPMAVPSSYNDLTQNATIRDHVGWAWYDRTFFVSVSLSRQRVVLRFGSAHYYAAVWLNGHNVMNHSGGHLPFEAEVSSYLKYNESNLLTVAINNTLTPKTIPQGTIVYQTDTQRYPPGYYTQEYTFDFFNYAGIHRSVVLYTTPQVYIDDVIVVTDVQSNSTGAVFYKIITKPSSSFVDNNEITCRTELTDATGKVVARSQSCSGQLTVHDLHPWWPYTMAENPGYLYTLKVSVDDGKDQDVYRVKVGIRTVTWNNSTFFINGRPFYFRGFGKHEDSNIRGKGLDIPLIIKDFNMIKWLGANSFRTSHYPYAEEIMDRADEEGIVVIDESPGVDLDNFDDELLDHHKRVMKELVTRDKNRPCVVMWSLANEARTQRKEAGPYFKQLADYVRQLDPTRPVTSVINQGLQSDRAAQYMDVVAINRYYAWYSDAGHLELVQKQAENEFTAWHEKLGKPILISEYGADTIAGMHMDPPFVFTEEFQASLMIQYFKAFDKLRSSGFFVGEMIWNFADFMTKQGITRVVGNKKGILTRERQPKFSAHVLRARYWSLAERLNSFSTIPDDLYLGCHV